jgi:beta-lactamase regulating signal transducer with metallopeptidase domain
MTALSLALLVKATLILSAAGLVTLAAGRRVSASARHLVWTAAVAACLALPLASLALPSWTIALPRMSAAPAVAEPDRASPAGAASLDSSVSLVAPATGDVATGPVAQSDTTPGATAGAWATFSFDRPTTWFAIYGLGVLVLLGRLAFERLALRRIARGAAAVVDPQWREQLADCARCLDVRRPVRLLRGLDDAMPMTFGVFRPVIVMPAIADTWSADRRRAVLLHELAHVARVDCATQTLAAVACALYWMHPGAWLAARRLRVERELACDDRVLSAGAGPRDYAQHLLELAHSLTGRRAPALALPMARPSQLEGRMLAVLDPARGRARTSLRTRVLVVSAAAMVAMPLAAASVTFIDSASPWESNSPSPSASPSPSPSPSASASPSPSPSPSASPSSSQSDRRALSLPGTWELRRSTRNPEMVNLQLRERPNSMSGFSIELSQLEGLSAGLLTGDGGRGTFRVRRDAGTLIFEGSFRSGVGAGTFDFSPSTQFADELARRGYDRPDTTDLYYLARAEIGTAYLDELTRQKYARPTLAGLVRAGDHGVSLSYLRGMHAAGYALGQLDPLITLRDHGVDPQFVTDMKAHGFDGLSADELRQARDHGVDGRFLAGMKDARLISGGGDIHAMIQLRDHGVDAGFVNGLRDAGVEAESLQHWVKARDHGVDGAFVRGLRDAGVAAQPLEGWITARDHGVDPKFVRAIADEGYRGPALDELVRMRDHGVDARFIRRANDERTRRLTVAELIRLRDRGGL